MSLNANWGTDDNETTVNGTTTDLPRLDSRQIGLSVDVLPVFSGYRTSALTEQARDNYVAASQTMVETRRTVERETRNAFMMSPHRCRAFVPLNKRLLPQRVLKGNRSRL